MSKNAKSFKLGRDTRTGQFVSVEKARRGNPERYVIEHVPKAGHGDTRPNGPKPPRRDK